MKNFLLVIDAQEGFMVPGVTDREESLINELLKGKFFDCVISSVYRNSPESNIIRFMGWDKLLTQQEQKVTAVVAAHTHHYIYKSTYSAYSDELVHLLKQENGGDLPECVYVVGFDLDCCVLMTAAQLFENGIRPIVLTKYCGASGGEEARAAGTRTLQSLIGANNLSAARIFSTADLRKILDFAKTAVHISSTPTQRKAQDVVDRLCNLGWHVSFAESCTGGMTAAGIVDVPSASSVFNESYVTYANDAKIRLLGVSADTIAQHGVVSEPVAAEMAIGAASEAGAQVGVGISGIAGPSGGTPTKPVGMVCFGFYIDGTVYTKTMQFGNIGRNAVRQSSVDFVYDTLLELLPRTNK